jgi:hypothetical protein
MSYSRKLFLTLSSPPPVCLLDYLCFCLYLCLCLCLCPCPALSTYLLI